MEKQVGTNRVGVKPRESIEGFVPFVQFKPNTTELNVIIQIEKAPPPEGPNAIRQLTLNSHLHIIGNTGSPTCPTEL